MMNKGRNFPSLLLLPLLLLSACKTSGDLRLEKMGQDPGHIKTISRSTQVEAKQQNPLKKESQLQGMDEDLARQLEMAKGQIQETQYLREQEKLQFESRIQSLEQDKFRLSEEIQILKGTAPAMASQGGDLLWEAAQKDLSSEKYSSALSNLKDFLENFPKDPRAEEALVLKGQSEYAAELFKESLVSFGQYLDKYSKGKGRPMAWLGQGTALLRMKQKKDAKLFLEQCVSLHPKSKEAKLAKRLLKTPQYVPPTLFL